MYDQCRPDQTVKQRPPSSSTEQSDGVKIAGRGKTQIRWIENPTNRQVTYSKRRSGIFKKANELSILCDAKVALFLTANNTIKTQSFISKNTTAKEMIDRYQQFTGTDVWEPQYERMKELLKQQKEKNNELRREIRQRMGYDLEDMSFSELRVLENSMSNAVQNIRSKKYNKLESSTNTCKKKVKNLEGINLSLLHNYTNFDDLLKQVKCEDNVEALGYESAVALANGPSSLYTFRYAQQMSCHSDTLNGCGGEVFDPYNAHDLRLG